MSGAKSGTKGKAAERELCKIASSIFGGSFIRADSSGAYIGGRNAHRKTSLSEQQKRAKKSDIVPPDHMPKLVVESKFYKEFRFHQILQPGPIPLLDDWIDQCLTVVDPDDFWLIAVKVNLRGWYVAVPEHLTTGMSFTNHARYTAHTHGPFVLTDLTEFWTTNRDAILALSA